MLTIELNQTAEERLRAEAAAKGMAAEVYAREILEGLLLPLAGQRLVDHWRHDGVIGSRPDITDSDAYSRELREQAWKRDSE